MSTPRPSERGHLDLDTGQWVTDAVRDHPSQPWRSPQPAVPVIRQTQADADDYEQMIQLLTGKYGLDEPGMRETLDFVILNGWEELRVARRDLAGKITEAWVLRIGRDEGGFTLDAEEVQP